MKEELELIKAKILEDEHKIAELERLKNDLVERRNTYYFKYFEEERPDYSNLKDIPPFDYFHQKQHEFHPTHPLAKYSCLNAILIGEFVKELFQKYEHEDVENFIHIEATLNEKYHDYGFEGYYYTYTPYVIIGNDKEILTGRYSKNIAIPLPIHHHNNDENLVPFSAREYYSSEENILFYNPYLSFISDSQRYGFEELEFDIKGYKFIRDLI